MRNATFTQVKLKCHEEKGIEILGLTLQRHNKFLKERENEQLPQVQSIGPDGMDGHHHWSTTDRLVSS